MPSGVSDEWMQGLQIGGNLMGSRLDRDARMQELKSRDAERRAEEARLSRLMDLKFQEYQLKVQRAADVEKATAKFNLLRSPIIPTAHGWVPNPKKMDTANAIMESFMPLASTPEEATQIANQASMVAARDANMEADAAKPYTKLGQLQADLERYKDNPMIAGALKKEIENYRDTEFAPSETQKMLNELNNAEKNNDLSAIIALNKKLGIGGLSVEQRMAFRAELSDIEKDLKLMSNPNERARRRQAVYDKYGVKGASDSTPASSQPTAKTAKPGEIVNGFRFNGKFPRTDRRAWDEVK